jgi:suppressor of fused protein SUFU
MPNETRTQSDDWQKIWDARIAALTPILGKPANTVLHAVVPFQLGGSADVVPFPEFAPGISYVTAEMTGEDVGQRPTTLGNYELMICARHELKKAGDLISRLARYTCDTELEPEQTMDIGTFFGDSTIRALLFAHPGDQPVHFEFLGERYGLLLCVGITGDELAYKKTHGSTSLLALLKRHDVFPYTIPDRSSVPLP